MNGFICRYACWSAAAWLIVACGGDAEPSTSPAQPASLAGAMGSLTAGMGVGPTPAGSPSVSAGGAGALGAPAGSPAAAAAGSGGAGKPASQVGGGAGAVGGGGGAAAGSGGAAAAAGAGGGGTGGTAGMGMMPLPDLGEGDGSDVVTSGDSWMSFALNGGGIEAALDRADTDYDHYSVPGTLLLNGQIPSQYDRAKREHPKIATVILTAGGNDVMSSGGCNTKEACNMTVQRVINGLDQLFMKMVADGVASTVYSSYSKHAGTGSKDTRPEVLPMPTVCTSGKLRCLVVETSDIIASSDLLDGVHPTQAGCDRIAKRTLEQMAKEGVR